MFDFAEAMVKNSGLEVGPLFMHEVEGHRALRAEGRQDFDGAALITRFQFVEANGCYFVNVGTMPEELAQHFAPALDGMFASFSLPNVSEPMTELFLPLPVEALNAEMKAPAGWMIEDDGKFVSVTQDERGIQIEMHKRESEGCTTAAIADALCQRYRVHEPEVETMRMRIGDLESVLLRNMQRGGKPVVKAILFKADEDQAIEICVTASPEEMTLAMNVMEEMVGSLRALAVA
jgi:hypothetical protein